MQFARAEETDKVLLISVSFLPPIDLDVWYPVSIKPTFYQTNIKILFMSLAPSLTRFLLRVSLPVYD